MKVPADKVEKLCKCSKGFPKNSFIRFRFSSNYFFEDLNFVRVNLLSKIEKVSMNKYWTLFLLFFEILYCFDRFMCFR